MKRSWERILVGGNHLCDPDWAGPLYKEVQAKFEVLRWRCVHDVTRFISRPVRL